MTPFDIRSWGYSYAEARAFLEAIGAEGRAYYKVRNFRRQTYSCARTKISAHHNPRAIRSGAPVEAGIRSCTGFRIGHLFWNLFTSTFLTAGLQTVFRVSNCRISDLSVRALLSMLRPWSSSQHALIWREGPALLKLAGFLRVIPI